MVSPSILPLTQPPSDWSILHSPDPTASVGTEGFVLAGYAAFIYNSISDLTGSIAVLLLPFARRMMVSKQVVGLISRWAMTMNLDDGLGLRRLEWSSRTNNGPSMGLARKMGFREEGVRRYDSVVREGSRGDHGEFD